MKTKITIIAILLVFIGTSVFAQNKDTDTIIIIKEPKGIENDKDNPVFVVVEEMPQFPGGQDSLLSFLAKNLVYPQELINKGIGGRVYITFTIEKDGSLTGIRILRGVDEALDEEALRVIRLMPNWEPGKQRGIPVRTQFNLPVHFDPEIN